MQGIAWVLLHDIEMQLAGGWSKARNIYINPKGLFVLIGHSMSWSEICMLYEMRPGWSNLVIRAVTAESHDDFGKLTFGS